MDSHKPGNILHLIRDIFHSYNFEGNKTQTILDSQSWTNTVNVNLKTFAESGNVWGIGVCYFHDGKKQTGKKYSAEKSGKNTAPLYIVFMELETSLHFHFSKLTLSQHTIVLSTNFHPRKLSISKETIRKVSFTEDDEGVPMLEVESSELLSPFKMQVITTEWGQYYQKEINAWAMESPIVDLEIDYSNEATQHTLREGIQLMKTKDFLSAFDRMHTTLLGLTRYRLQQKGLTLDREAKLPGLMKTLLRNHTVYSSDLQNTRIRNLIQGMITSTDAINTLRNKSSLAHANDELLSNSEAELGCYFLYGAIKFLKELDS